MTVAVNQPSRACHLEEPPDLRPAIAEVLGEEPSSITVERTHFPGSRPVQRVYGVTLSDGRCTTLIAECCPVDPQSHAASVRASLRKTRNGQKAGFDARAVVVAPVSGLVLRRPGLDERLPGLRLLHDPVFARHAVRTVLGHDFGPVGTVLVAHRLGKRAVLRITGAELDVFVRLRSIKSGEGDARLGRHRALWRSLSAGAALRIPEPLGALPEIGAAFFAVLPGQAPDFQGSDVDAVARAIRALQALDPAGLSVHSAQDEARVLRQWLGRCRDGRPQLARRIAPALEHLIAKMERTCAPQRPCHRDLHEKQILVRNGVAGLLDFDTLCLSDPALDVGNLLAHLFMAGEGDATLRGRFDLPGIGLWRSAALFRLAMIYSFTSVPDAELDRLMEEACADADD